MAFNDDQLQGPSRFLDKKYYSVGKVLNVASRIEVWRKFLFFFSCIWLAACSAPVWVVKPIDISRAEQRVTADFVVSKLADYRFALLFVQGNTLDEIISREEILGTSHKEGVAIPLHLRVLKDGTPVFDGNIVTTRIYWGQTFDYQGQRINTAVRLIKTLELSPGKYSVEVGTLGEVQAFRSIESYVEFSYYNPKH
ncbi:DUF5625 family protein [Pseudomonas chlororaphis]|uniref:DUF5625 family protein n=1 Tax=Pseudomonas chlororaphis TaxID=587753 RepID=UPI001CF4D644|nr:DUF5625 family protein [Pseudomonas chlororaphis]UCR87603.1 DUF5625 family protein [Pseudomonas chlororaphis]